MGKQVCCGGGGVCECADTHVMLVPIRVRKRGAGWEFLRGNSVIHLTYARLLVIPHQLSADYSFDCLQLLGEYRVRRSPVSKYVDTCYMKASP